MGHLATLISIDEYRQHRELRAARSVGVTSRATGRRGRRDLDQVAGSRRIHRRQSRRFTLLEGHDATARSTIAFVGPGPEAA